MPPTRSASVLGPLLLACGLAASPWHHQTTATEPSTGRFPAGTLQQFVAGRLSVVKPEDADFIDRVAAHVRRGELPESMVRGTCEWAATRAMRRGVTYPFAYFRTAITSKARRLGVML